LSNDFVKRVCPNGASFYPDGVPVFPNSAPVFPDRVRVFPNSVPVFPDGASFYPDGVPVCPNGARAFPDGVPVCPDRVPVEGLGCVGWRLGLADHGLQVCAILPKCASGLRPNF